MTDLGHNGAGDNRPGARAVHDRVIGAPRLSYAILRPAQAPTEDEVSRVLMIMDSADEAEEVAAELRTRGIAAEIRTAAGSGTRLRLSRQ